MKNTSAHLAHPSLYLPHHPSNHHPTLSFSSFVSNLPITPHRDIILLLIVILYCQGYHHRLACRHRQCPCNLWGWISSSRSISIATFVFVVTLLIIIRHWPLGIFTTSFMCLLNIVLVHIVLASLPCRMSSR